ncbi:MAG: hypothetical protein WCS17_03980 [Prevotella sp.]
MKKITNPSPKSSPPHINFEVEGQENLIPHLDRPWDPANITIEDIKKYADDFFIVNTFMKLSNFVFIGKPTYNVVQGDNSREDIAIVLRDMVKKIGFYSFLKKCWYDTCIWGTSFYSEGVEREGTRWMIHELRSLPPELFANPGSAAVSPEMWGNYSMNPNYTYGRLLKGIERRDDDTIHYWQRIKYQIVEIKNCRHIKSPIRSYFLDGVPLFNPLYKLLPKIGFAVDLLMMANNKSDLWFLEMPAGGSGQLPDQKTSVWEYCKSVMRAATNKVRFILPAGVTVQEVKTPPSDIHLKTVDLLVKWLISYITPSDIISKGDGSLIGGSSNYEAQLFKMFSEGMQSYIEDEIAEPVLNEWLAWNGWGDCHVEVKLQRLTFDNSELDIKVAQILIDALNNKDRPVVLASSNEIREKLGFENADVDFLKKSRKEIDEINGVPPLSESPASTKTPNKEETLSEDEVSDVIKGNQSFMRTREEIQATLEQQLTQAYIEYYSAVGA